MTLGAQIMTLGAGNACRSDHSAVGVQIGCSRSDLATGK